MIKDVNFYCKENFIKYAKSTKQLRLQAVSTIS